MRLCVLLLLFVIQSATNLLADDFDSLINLDRAFRDEILGAKAPSVYQSLIREGETTITFVDDLPASVGKTDFFLNMDWSYDYRYKTRVDGDVKKVEVIPQNIKLKPQLRHVIRMPNAYYYPEVWKSRLLGHEFDHVAVSLDARPRVLLHRLCSKLPAFRFSIKADEKPTDERMRAGINAEIQRRQNAVLDLIRANYVLLDKVSTHGRVSIADRKKFFISLYSRQNLDQQNFAYTDEVTSFVESESYKKLQPRFVSADPATTGE